MYEVRRCHYLVTYVCTNNMQQPVDGEQVSGSGVVGTIDQGRHCAGSRGRTWLRLAWSGIGVGVDRVLDTAGAMPDGSWT